MDAASIDPPTLDLLTWIADRRRSYAEVREVWPSTCPRLTVWEDALGAGLVCVVRRDDGSGVELTAAGRSALDCSVRPAEPALH